MSMRVSWRWRQGQRANGNGRKVWLVKPSPSRANNHENKDKDSNVKDKNNKKYIEPLPFYNNAIISSSASASGCKQKTFTFMRIMSTFALAVLVGGFIVNIKSHFSSASPPRLIIPPHLRKQSRWKQQSIVTDHDHELPQDWQTFGFQQIRNHFKCDTFDRVLKPPSMKKWQMILDAYNKEVDSSYKFNLIVPPTEGGYVFDEVGQQHGHGSPPFHARSTKMGIHRGLFATWDIRKGDLIHDGSGSDVVFPDAMAYRRFVFALPQRAACDM